MQPSSQWHALASGSYALCDSKQGFSRMFLDLYFCKGEVKRYPCKNLANREDRQAEELNCLHSNVKTKDSHQPRDVW